MASKYMPVEGQGALVLRGGAHVPECFRTAAWRPTPLVDLPSFRHAKRIGLDTETKDEDLEELGPGVRRPGNRLAGYSFAIEDGPKHYVPIAHEGGDNVEGNAIGWFCDEIKNFTGEIVGANLPYEYDWLGEAGADFSGVRRWLDVQVADPLLYELHPSYKLDAILKRWALPGKNEEGLRAAAKQMRLDPKKHLWRMPARHVGPYAEDDAFRPLGLMRLQEKKIEEQGIGECWDMECRLLPVLIRMTRRGVTVNEDRLDQIEEWTKREEQRACDAIHRLTNVRVPVGDSMNTQLIKSVCDEAKIPVNESIAKDVLTPFMNDKDARGDVARAMARARQVATLRTTFVAGTRRHLVNGRIHCTFNQIRKTDDKTDETSGVAYGRLSTSHVNLQNQPGNSRFSGDNEVGPMWRSIYGPNKPDHVWAANDLKQQEPKWSFHFAALLEEVGLAQEARGERNCHQGAKGALALCAKLMDDPRLDTYEPIVQIAKVKRPTAKIMWLARCYGQGEGTLCENLGLSTVQMVFVPGMRRAAVPVDSEDGQRIKGMPGAVVYKGAGEEGKRIIRAFDDELPFLKYAAKVAKQTAEDRGYVKLISGRRCHFEGKDGAYEFTHKAFNRIIQGSAAEQTKRIMLAVAETDFEDLMLLQVHDELDFELPDEATAYQIAEVMRSAVPMKCPTVVDTEVGPSWGESMGVEYVDRDGKKQKVTYKWGMKIIDKVPVYHSGPLAGIPEANVVSTDLQLLPQNPTQDAFNNRTDIQNHEGEALHGQ